MLEVKGLVKTKPVKTSKLLRELLLKHGTREHYPKGTFLFRKGSPAKVVLVLKGSVLLAGPSVNNLALLNRQDVFGLSESIGHNNCCPKSAFAITPLDVYSLTAGELNRYVTLMPELRKLVLSELLNRHQNVE